MANEDRGLFGDIPLPRENGERYSVRGPQKKWSLQENLLLFPVLMSTESKHAYAVTVREMCRILKRPARLHEGCRPTDDRISEEEHSLIEHRTITDILGNDRGFGDKLVTFARPLMTGFRTGWPLTWAEKARFFNPHYKNIRDKKQHISNEEVLLFLDRGKEDLLLLEEYIDRRHLGAPDEEREVTNAPYPADPNNRDDLRDLIKAFMAVDVKDKINLACAWDELVMFCYTEDE